MPTPSTHAPKPSQPMPGMDSTGHMFKPDVHKEPGTVLTPAVQIFPQ